MGKKRIEGMQDESLGWPADMPQADPTEHWPPIAAERTRIRAELAWRKFAEQFPYEPPYSSPHYDQDRDLGDEHAPQEL